MPASRSRRSFARRSAISAFSSCGGVPSLRSMVASLQSLLEARFHERVERPVEHRLRVAGLVSRPEVLEARLVEDIGTDLMAPANVRLLVLEHARGGVPLVHLELVELGLEHLHGRRPVLVLAALALACDHD